MGGNAFAKALPDGLFPRMPPAVYRALKRTVEQQLAPLYAIVTTPAEAPHKADHGDIDFVVVEPRAGLTHADLVAALGAEQSIPQEGNRTSNFAMRIPPLERPAVRAHMRGTATRADDAGVASPGAEASASAEMYYQVDVHVCSDREEWERVVFMHGYGDLGMILGVVAKGVGLHLGLKGLKVGSQPWDPDFPPSFPLSSSFGAIVPFFGLSLERCKMGFATQAEIFDWVLTSRFFDARRVKEPTGARRQRLGRAMYHDFLQHAYDLVKAGKYSLANDVPDERAVLEEALVYFGRKDAFDEVVRKERHQKAMNALFTGRKVSQWTGIDQSTGWRIVKRLMAKVRMEMGDEEAMLLAGEEAVKAVTMALKDEAVREVQAEWEALPDHLEGEYVEGMTPGGV